MFESVAAHQRFPGEFEMLRSKFGGHEFTLIRAAILRAACERIDADSVLDAAADELAKKIAAAAPNLNDSLIGQTVSLHPISSELLGKLAEVRRCGLGAFVLRADGAEHWVEGTIENQAATVTRYELNRAFRKILGL